MIGCGKPGGAASDYGNAFAIAPGVLWLDITFAEGGFDDGGFVFADGDRFVAA